MALPQVVFDARLRPFWPFIPHSNVLYVCKLILSSILSFESQRLTLAIRHKVIILSAALDLVPPDVPKGVILFANIFPALLVKLGWPYFVPGRVRYGRRVLACSVVSFLGIVVGTPLATLQTTSSSPADATRTGRSW